MNRRILMEQEVRSVKRQVTINLIGADLVETLHAILAAGIHHNSRTENIGFQEDSRIFYTSVYMAFSSKVDYDIRMLFLEN